MRSRYFQRCSAILFEQKVGNRMKIIFTCQVKKILKKMTSIRISDNVFMQTVFTHCNLLSILFSFHHSDLSSLVYKWICFLFSPVLIHYCIANSNSNLRPVISSFRHSTESRVRNLKEGILRKHHPMFAVVYKSWVLQ